MKARILIYGCLIIGLCLSLTGCGDDEKVTEITGIEVSPSTIPAMEIGDELQLTAQFSPSNATEDIIWKSWNEKIVKIEGTGTNVTLKAIGFGETRIFATSTSRIVVSRDIAIKVNSDDYAGLMTGNYLGSGTSAMGPIDGMAIKIERAGSSNSKVNLTIVAEMSGFGEQTITGEGVDIKLGSEPGTYGFSGSAKMEIPGMIKFDFTISGKFNSADKSLTLKLADLDNPVFPLVIDIDAVPGAPADYGMMAAGDYAGKADITNSPMGAIPGLDMDITITRISSNKVDLIISSSMGDIVLKEGQEIEVTAGTANNTCSLTGNVYMALLDADLAVSGTINLIERTLTMELTSQVLSATITAELDIAKVVEGEYSGDGTLAGMSMDQDLSGVPVILTRIDKQTVNMFANALVAFDCDLTVAPDGNFYSLTGATNMMGMDFTVTGTHNPATQTFTVSISNPAIQIELSAVKQ